jgi:DNA-directed RNA polymerase specialized sigma24 family protein
VSRSKENAPDLEASRAEADKPGAFSTTHWSQVTMAGQKDPAVAGAAMEKLYTVYRLPIYNFICRQYGCNHHDAEDLTQGFFEHLVQKATVKRADRDIGKFRNFLLGALNHFRSNERDRALAEKRGGKCQLISLDETDAPQVGGREAPVPLLADKTFNQAWACALVQQAREQLKEKYHKAGKAPLFAALEPALLREDAKDLYAHWAASLETQRRNSDVCLRPLWIEAAGISLGCNYSTILPENSVLNSFETCLN